jgi:hypothetical protein
MFQPSTRFWASALFAILCFVFLYVGRTRETRIQREADISEAVFRKLLETPDVSNYSRASGVCISNKKRRLNSTFLRRFKEKFPRQAWAGDPPLTVDLKAPKCAVVLSLAEIHWLSDTEVNVEGGYACGTMCGFSANFHVRRGGWGWYVDEINPIFISGFGDSHLISAAMGHSGGRVYCSPAEPAGRN